MKKRKTKNKIIISLFAAAAIIMLNAWGFSMKPVSYSVNSDKLGTPVRIVFISDLHNCFYGGKDQSGLWAAIEDAQPDIVLFGGDVIDHMGGFTNALTIMEMVKEKYPCAYAAGNHEMIRSDRQDFFDAAEALGIPVLHGRYAEFTVRGQKIRVYGVIDAYEYGSGGTQLDNCYETLDSSCYNVLLAHQPEQLEQYIRYDIDGGRPPEGSFDLVLSGHAHGGQWRIPGILEQGLYAPDQGVFPEFTTGQRELDGTVQIVSRGLARPLRMIAIPRIFNRPELSVIEIT